MGQVLSEPVTTKHTTNGKDERFSFGVSEMQGWRITMEDAHAHVLDVDADQQQSTEPSKSKTSFFAVYDGHGGSAVARYAGDTVHSRLKAQDEYKKKDYSAALKRTFLATDEDMRANREFVGDPSGCTAVSVLIPDDGKVYCANAGDSRSVMSVKGEAKPLSFDHKPVNKGENARIVAAGGFVEFGRVNGNLALSRALGDFEFKQNSNMDAESQVVTADPEITIHETSDDDEFIILACDGIWDVLNSQECVDCVRRAIADKTPLEKICESMMERCLAPDSDCSGVGCDNMTIMIVAILHGQSEEEWYEKIAKRVESGEGYKTPAADALPNPLARRPGTTSAPRGLSGLGSVLGGNSGLLNHITGGGSQYADYKLDGDEDEDDGNGLLANLGSALRREGVNIEPMEEHGDEHSMDVDADSDKEENTASATNKNDEVAHPSVQAEGLLDKSEDPTKS